jgi:hypothetical protein
MLQKISAGMQAEDAINENIYIKIKGIMCHWRRKYE